MEDRKQHKITSNKIVEYFTGEKGYYVEVENKGTLLYPSKEKWEEDIKRGFAFDDEIEF